MIRFSVHYFMLFAFMATVLPYFQLFLEARGFSKAQVGYLQGLFAVAGIAAPLAAGYLADRLGKRRWILAACLAGFPLFIIPLNVAAGVGLAAVLVIGVGATARPTIPLTDALASAELADPQRRYGQVRVWGSAGFVLTLLGVRLAGLIDENSATSIMIAMLATAGLCLASSLLLPDRHRRPARRSVGEGVDGGPEGAASSGEAPAPREGRIAGAFWILLVAAALHQTGMSCYYAFFTLYLHDVAGMDQAAWVWAIGAAAEIPLLFYAGALVRRIGIPAMLLAAMAAGTLRLAIYAQTDSLYVILPTQLLHGMTFGMYWAAAIELIRRSAPTQRRGLAMALFMAVAVGVPRWIGSTAAGFAVETWGYATAFGGFAAAPLAGAVFVAINWRRLGRSEPDPAMRRR